MLRTIGITAVAAVLAAACGGSAASGATGYTQPSNTPADTAASPPAAPTAAPVGSAVDVAGSGLGQILVDSRGITLYLFEADMGGSSTCYGSCASNWPPLVTPGMPVAGPGAVQSLLGTAARRDGSVQVTYNGRPLYYFVADKKPGDLLGQGIDAFGGGWYVLSPAGDKIDTN